MNMFTIIGAAVIGAFSASSAVAAIVSVSGPASSGGTGPAIIGAPSDILEDLVTNTGMEGFDEAQNVLLTAPLSVDGGTIAAGTRVDSHMIFLNSLGSTRISHYDVDWTFSGRILGVMSDSGGTLEAASSSFLGAPGTNYTTPGAGTGAAAPFTARGLESNNGTGIGGEGYSVAGNVLTLGMVVTEPGDWVRVVTAPIPVPAALPLLAGALGGLGLLRGRKAKSAA